MKNAHQDIPAKRHNETAKQLAETRKGHAEVSDEKAGGHAHAAQTHSAKEHSKKHTHK